jgi:hypothetical protein
MDDKSKPQHREGSRKGKVHALYDKQGQDAAWTLGLKLKLKESTLRTWLGTWNRGAVKPKPKANRKAKVPKAKASVEVIAPKVNGLDAGVPAADA